LGAQVFVRQKALVQSTGTFARHKLVWSYALTVSDTNFSGSAGLPEMTPRDLRHSAVGSTRWSVADTKGATIDHWCDISGSPATVAVQSLSTRTRRQPLVRVQPCIRVTQLQIKYTEASGTPFEKCTGKKSSETVKPCVRSHLRAGDGTQRRGRRAGVRPRRFFSRVRKAWCCGRARALCLLGPSIIPPRRPPLQPNDRGPGARSPRRSQSGFGGMTDTCQERYIETAALALVLHSLPSATDYSVR
jgi:hypothetical protein